MVFSSNLIGGLSQMPIKFTNQTASRALNTVYQNTGLQPMLVIITSYNITNGTRDIFCDSSNPPTTVVNHSRAATGTARHNVIFIVKPGNYYKASGTATVLQWNEWT